MPRLPYPGLRAFRREEADLFFGRDEEIDTIVERVTANRFLGVLGASGSGKSSLVRTGLFESLDGGFNQVGADWRIVDCHPGGTPIANLAAELSRASQGDGEGGDPAAVEAWLRNGPRAIVEWCESGNLAPGSQLLILVDQFEELFNYGTLADREDAHLLASLLVESAKSDRAPIFVVITMRSDYFGACGTYPELADAISKSLFLTPRMLRDACSDAILCPAAVMDFEIGDDLVTLLLNDMERFAPFGHGGRGGEPATAGRQADQLPLMQYALNRMWQNAVERKDERIVLTAQDYRDIGGLEGALDKHADQVTSALGIPEDAIERTFQSLVRGSSVALAIRDPHTLEEIAAIGGLDLETVTAIVSAFAGEDCQFLRVDTPVRPGSFADISHESLIRQWSKLSDWLVKEAHAAESWRSLAADTRDWQRDGRPEEALLRGLQLTRRRDWWDSQRLTQSWANRYPLSPREGEAAVTVGAVDEFLNISEKHAAAEEERAKRLRQRLQFTGAAAAVAMTLASGAFAWGEAQNAETQSRLRRAAAERAEQTYWFGKQQGVLREAAQREAVRARNAEMAAKRNAQNAAISAKNEAAAALRATRLAKEAQSSAALATASSAAMLATIESNLSDLASAREEVQRPASSTREQAESLGRQLDPRAVRRPTQSASQLGAMAALLAGEAAAGEVGTSKPPAKTAEYMSMQADSVLSAVRDVPAMTARAAILQGRAAELRGSAEDFRTAAAAYETALDSSAGDGGIQAQLAALEASTALIRLHRRLGITPRQEQAARQCLEASLPPSPSPAFVPLLECRLAVAELRLSQGDRKAAETLLDDISANAAPSVSGPDGTPLTLPETSLPRLKLRILSRYLWGEATQMASTTDVRDETLVEQAKRYSEMNPETEEASSLYALALEAFNQDLESAFAIRRPLLENSETSTGYLMDSVPLLQRFESEQPAQSLESLGEDNSAIRSTIESLRRSGGLMQVLRTLDARHAPDPRLPGQSDHDSHSALLRAAEDRAAKRAADIDAMFRSAGERNDLLTDLRLYPDAYLSPEDRSQIQSLMDLLDLYEAACSPGTGHSDCQQNVRGVEHVLAPIQERWQPTRRRGGLKFGVEVSESDLPWFNGYDVVAYNLAGRPIRGNARFAVDLGGRKLLFSSQENLEQYTRASLPEYGGAAVEWVKVGEVKPGNPRYFCPIEGRVFLFYSLNTRDRWCRLGKGSARDTLINGVDMAWRDLGREAVPAMPEVTFADPISGTAVKSPSRVVYPLTSTTVVRSPAAGVVFTFRDGMIRIGHADGSYSLLAIQGGRFQIGAGTWLRKGETIPTSLDATVETGKLIWDLKIPSAEIE